MIKLLILLYVNTIFCLDLEQFFKRNLHVKKSASFIFKSVNLKLFGIKQAKKRGKNNFLIAFTKIELLKKT